MVSHALPVPPAGRLAMPPPARSVGSLALPVPPAGRHAMPPPARSVGSHALPVPPASRYAMPPPARSVGSHALPVPPAGRHAMPPPARSVGSLALPVPPAGRHGEKRPLACVSTPAEYFVQHGHIVTATERAARVKAAQDLYMVGEARGWTPAVPAERNQTVAYFAVTYSKGHLDSARTAVGAWELFCQEEGLPPWPADWVRVYLFLQAVRALHDTKAGDNNRGTEALAVLAAARLAARLATASPAASPAAGPAAAARVGRRPAQPRCPRPRYPRQKGAAPLKTELGEPFSGAAHARDARLLAETRDATIGKRRLGLCPVRLWAQRKKPSTPSVRNGPGARCFRPHEEPRHTTIAA